MIAILPDDSGSLWARRPTITTCWPTSSMSGRRSRTTVPPSAWMNLVSSSRRRTSWRCVPVVVSTHSDWTRGRSSAACAARSAPERARPASTGANPCWAGGSLSAIARFDVDVRKQPIDGCRGDLGADLVVFDHLPRDRLEPVFVEDRVLHVEGEHPDEREEDREDGERSRADQAHSCRSSRIRVVRHVGHLAEHRPQARPLYLIPIA